MSRRGDHHASERLVELQRLAATLSREELGRACRETDERAEAERSAADRNRRAETALDEVLARPQLCLDYFVLAGLDLEVTEARLVASRTALAAARDDEASALASHDEAGQRLEWIAGHARELRRKHLEKREERAMSEAAMLRARRGGAR